MGAKKSKLFTDINANTKHNITQITIDELFDSGTHHHEFTQELFKYFLIDEKTDEEDEECSLVRTAEFYKNDCLLAFTDTQTGKSVSNLSLNSSKFN